MNENEVSGVLLTREEFEQMNKTLKDLAEGAPRLERQARKEFNRKEVSIAFQEAFELIGGVRRLAVWANENPTEFFKLYGRQLPTGAQVDINASGEIIFKHVLPPSKLDALPENVDGRSNG